MVMIEMREAAQDKVLDLIDESKDLRHQQKIVMCELEDAIYDCFEDMKDGEKHEEGEEGKDLGFKRGYNRHYAMRNFEDDDEKDMHHSYDYRRHAMRMRRNRMGRYTA